MNEEAGQQIRTPIKKRVISGKKLGRPTECVKSREVKVRLTEAQFERLEAWADKCNITIAEALRRAIDAATEAK